MGNKDISISPAKLVECIKAVIEKYGVERDTADLPMLYSLLNHVALYMEWLKDLKQEFSKEDFNVYFSQLKLCEGFIKKSIEKRLANQENAQSLGGRRAGFGAMWLFGAATGVAIFGLIILGTLYL